MLSLFGPEQMASNVTINIVESDSQIEKMILRSLVKEINQVLPNIKNKIQSNIKPVIREALFNSQEIMSLEGGVLRLDFGIPIGKSVSAPIVETIVNSLSVRVVRATVSGSSLKGGIEIRLQPTDYTNLLILQEGKTVIEKGGVLPWLEWLLLLGDAIIVGNFGVEYEAGTGRSGGAHMAQEARPFKVNTTFSGTVTNNFITRAMNEYKLQIMDAIEKSF